MKTLGNIIWFLFAGLWSWLSWTFVGLLLCITVIGIPFGIQCFKIGNFGLFPFGKRIEASTNIGSLFLNLIWILIFGWELALLHLFSAFLLAITIIGLPFAAQSVKMAGISLFPFGAKIHVD